MERGFIMNEMEEIKKLVDNLRMANDQMAEELRAALIENHRLKEELAILKGNGLTHPEVPTPPDALPGNAIK